MLSPTLQGFVFFSCSLLHFCSFLSEGHPQLSRVAYNRFWRLVEASQWVSKPLARSLISVRARWCGVCCGWCCGTSWATRLTRAWVWPESRSREREREKEREREREILHVAVPPHLATYPRHWQPNGWKVAATIALRSYSNSLETFASA